MRLNYEDVVGVRFGRITITAVIGKDKTNNAIAVGTCDCGEKVTALVSNLRRGAKKSCGCLRKDQDELLALVRRAMASNNYRNTDTIKEKLKELISTGS